MGYRRFIVLAIAGSLAASMLVAGGAASASEPGAGGGLAPSGSGTAQPVPEVSGVAPPPSVDQGASADAPPPPEDTISPRVAAVAVSPLAGEDLSDTVGSRAAPAVHTQFEAVADTASFPPDTNGAVGPNHVMTVTNGADGGGVLIQQKTGEYIGSEVALDTWWSLGSGDDAFDPVTLYDERHGRWINVAVADASGSGHSGSKLLFSVSRFDDPAGQWYRYHIDVDASDEMWADRPMVGFNDRWITVTATMFDLPGGAANATRTQVWVFPTDGAYDGGSISWSVWSNLTGSDFINPPFNMVPAVSYDAATTVYLLGNWNGNAVVGGTTYGALRLWKITGTAASPSLDNGTEIAVDTVPWEDYCGDIAPQSGISRKINVGDARIQKVILQGGALWAVHTTCYPHDSTPTYSAVQWWRLSTSGTVLERGRFRNTDGSVSRAYPSIAVNETGDALVGYARFTSSTHPSAAFMYRPSGGSWEGSTFRSGRSTYQKVDPEGRNRWGDYTATWVDPNGEDLWTIGEYSDATPNTWSTWWALIKLTADPVVSAGGVTSINEGSWLDLWGDVSDADSTSWTGTVDYDDPLDPGEEAITVWPFAQFHLQHKYMDNTLPFLFRKVEVCVTDEAAGSDCDTLLLAVGNVAPTVSAGGDATVALGGSFSRGGSITDPGADTFTGTVDYGEGGGAEALSIAGTSFSLGHVYATPGLHTVTVAVDDDDGGHGTATFSVRVRPRCNGQVVTVDGATDGDDVLFGTGGDDVIAGLGGNDEIDGMGGNDLICGGDGKDLLIGGDGNDRLFGGDGRDRLLGGDGRDRLYGEGNHDRLKGGGNLDWLYGGLGNDWLSGGPGNDEAYGQKGNDQMFGQRGKDLLNGGSGWDEADGGPHSDVCFAEVRLRCE